MNAVRVGSFERLLAISTHVAAGAAGIIIIFMMLVSIVDVVGRYFFNAPLASAYELVQFSMVLIVFGGLALCGYVGGHVSINLLGALLNRPFGRWIKAIVHACGAVLFALIAWRSGLDALSYYSTGEVSNTTRIPFYLFVAAVALGSGLYCVVLALDAWKTIRSKITVSE